VNIATLNLQKAKLSWLDFFAFSAYYSPSTSVSLTNTTYTGVQVGLFINFASIIQKPIIIKESKEELAIAKLAADEYMLTIETDVKSRYFRYMQAVTSLRVRNQVLIDVDALYKQVKYKFERGEATFENYNTALVQLAKQKQDIIEAEAAVLIAKSSLEELVGLKLEEVK
jgi:outer membrane protein TolC